MVRFSAILFALVAVLFSAPLAQADYPPPIPPGTEPIVIWSDSGGLVDEYMRWSNNIVRSGRRVEIRGPCLSACTLILQVPRERLCVASSAQLGFHHVRYYDLEDINDPGTYSAKATRELISKYPSQIRRWIKSRGGLTKELIYLEGEELPKFFNMCQSW